MRDGSERPELRGSERARLTAAKAVPDLGIVTSPGRQLCEQLDGDGAADEMFSLGPEAPLETASTAPGALLAKRPSHPPNTHDSAPNWPTTARPLVGGGCAAPAGSPAACSPVEARSQGAAQPPA